MTWRKVFSNPSLTWVQWGEHNIRSNTVEYGLRDDKGRSIGGYAVIEYGTFYKYGPDYKLESVVRTGAVFLRTQATRDGKTYGAIANRTECSSLEQAKTLAEKKLQTAAKRYAKQFGAK